MSIPMTTVAPRATFKLRVEYRQLTVAKEFSSVELIKLAQKPWKVWVGAALLHEPTSQGNEGRIWEPGAHLLRVDH
jgi:hypothetical protein